MRPLHEVTDLLLHLYRELVWKKNFQSEKLIFKEHAYEKVMD